MKIGDLINFLRRVQADYPDIEVLIPVVEENARLLSLVSLTIGNYATKDKEAACLFGATKEMMEDVQRRSLKSVSVKVNIPPGVH